MEKNDVSEDLSEWEHIQFNKNNALLTKDSIFPPNDHEDLPVSTPRDNEQVHVLLFRGGCDDDDDDDDRKGGVERPESNVKKSKRLYLGVLNSGLYRIRNFDFFKVGLWSVCGVAAVVLVSWLHRRVMKWRKSMMMEHKEYLLLLIKQKDQKINQLLLRIAQMNEILLGRRKVPVLRVN
ncbi:Uncharacterized protein Adt_00582 [Abeliophyllum distichum]|uniref:Transmembrane protein n=1 Tax=Abeliophyllum distichum TaxID=126358 RepID=A0ABD1VQH1_9LAMI